MGVALVVFLCLVAASAAIEQDDDLTMLKKVSEFLFANLDLKCTSFNIVLVCSDDMVKFCVLGLHIW